MAEFTFSRTLSLTANESHLVRVPKRGNFFVGVSSLNATGLTYKIKYNVDSFEITPDANANVKLAILYLDEIEQALQLIGDRDRSTRPEVS